MCGLCGLNLHLLRRLQKEVTGRVRSLRFFENVRKLQREGGAASMGDATSTQRSLGKLALLSCCGHVGEADKVQRAASEQLCFEHPHCKAAARPSCVIPVGQLGMEEPGGGAVGVKLAAVLGLVKRLPKDERVLIFVQVRHIRMGPHPT